LNKGDNKLVVVVVIVVVVVVVVVIIIIILSRNKLRYLNYTIQHRKETCIYQLRNEYPRISKRVANQNERTVGKQKVQHVNTL
jgi:predicted Holliday junction resolvase-like endonuclease